MKTIPKILGTGLAFIVLLFASAGTPVMVQEPITATVIPPTRTPTRTATATRTALPTPPPPPTETPADTSEGG